MIKVAAQTTAFGKQALQRMAEEMELEIEFVDDVWAATLVCGLEAVRSRVGPLRLKRLQAPSPWGKARLRASWDCYVIRDERSEFFVSCLDPDVVRRGWVKRDRIKAALRWASLSQPVAPLSPPQLCLTRPDDFVKADTFNITISGMYYKSWLALDVEGGIGEPPERIALSTAHASGTFRWDEAVARVTVDTCAQSDRILAWNWGFDRASLMAAGIGFSDSVLWDCMIAHQALYPTESFALGHATPMYMPTEHWKHKAQTDAEAYNVKDAWVLGHIYEEQHAMLWARGQASYFLEHLQPATWMFKEMSEREVLLDGEENPAREKAPRSGLAKLYHVAEGAYGTAKDTTWELVPFNKALYCSGLWGHWRGAARTKAGRRLRYVPYDQSYRRIVRHLTGCIVTPKLPEGDWLAEATNQAIDLHLLGYGPGQIRDRTDLKYGEARELKEGFDSFAPEFVEWRDAIRKSAVKDGFLQNSFGRRAWGVRDGMCERFMISSEFTDGLIKEALIKTAAGKAPYAMTSDGFLEVDDG